MSKQTEEKEFINKMLNLRFNCLDTYAAEQGLSLQYPVQFRNLQRILDGIFPDFIYNCDHQYSSYTVDLVEVPFAIFSDNYSGPSVLSTSDFNHFLSLYGDAIDCGRYFTQEERRAAVDSMGFTLEGFNTLSIFIDIVREVTGARSAVNIKRDIAIHKRKTKFKYKFSHRMVNGIGVFPVTVDPEDLAAHSEDIFAELVANGGRMFNEIKQIAFTQLPLNLIGE